MFNEKLFSIVPSNSNVCVFFQPAYRISALLHLILLLAIVIVPSDASNSSTNVPVSDVTESHSKNETTTVSKRIKEEEPHFGRLDIRVGRIIHVEKHPVADSLYVEKVDLGEENPRTIVSGLVQHVPIEQMENRTALFLVNLKPVKIRKIVSEGMIMCAQNETAGKVEVLTPPQDARPGDFVTVEGLERKPDAQIDAKKKMFEVIQKHLKTNDNKEATYKGVLWNVAGKGPALSLTLTNCSIS